MNIKGKGQRLIPEELLKYLEALKNKYPDAVDLVEANPTLEGDEDSLSSVLINGTKYAVGGGSEVHLYQHNIKYSYSGYYAFLNVLNDSSTPFDKTSLESYLKTNGFTSNNNAGLVAIGQTSDNKIIGAFTIYYDSITGWTLNSELKPLSFSSMTDVVVQIF